MGWVCWWLWFTGKAKVFSFISGCFSNVIGPIPKLISVLKEWDFLRIIMNKEIIIEGMQLGHAVVVLDMVKLLIVLLTHLKVQAFIHPIHLKGFR